MATPNTPPTWQTKVDYRLLTLPAALKDHQADAARPLPVFIQFQGDPARLQALGIEVQSISGSVAAATVTLAHVSRVARHADILFIESAREVRPNNCSGG